MSLVRHRVYIRSMRGSVVKLESFETSARPGCQHETEGVVSASDVAFEFLRVTHSTTSLRRFHSHTSPVVQICRRPRICPHSRAAVRNINHRPEQNPQRELGARACLPVSSLRGMKAAVTPPHQEAQCLTDAQYATKMRCRSSQPRSDVLRMGSGSPKSPSGSSTCISSAVNDVMTGNPSRCLGLAEDEKFGLVFLRLPS